MSEFIFVYGTLRPAMAPPEMKHIVGRWKPVGSGTVLGQLLDLGDYTGAVLDANTSSRIVGEAFEMPNDPAMLAELDEYEGFEPDEPETSLFCRVKTEVKLASGGNQSCWMYVYNHGAVDAASRNGRQMSKPAAAAATAGKAQKKSSRKTTKPEKELNEQNQAPTFTLEQAQDLESQFLMQTYARNPVMLVRAKGSTIFDANGKAYLDFISGIGVNVLGYDHPRVRRVLREQGDLLHTSNLYYHPFQGQLAEKLAKAAGMARVFFCNTGTEANEGALKLARGFHHRQGRIEQTEFVALTNSFHGRTLGALSLTGQEKYRKPFEPLIPGVSFIDPNNCADNFAEARAAITERTAAVFIETIQGESGVVAISDEFLKVIRQRCDETGALLVLDEVQCGLGRTGKLFAFENTSVKPDVLCVAKPLGLGVPLGAFLVAEKFVEGLKAGDHGTTFGGGPLACRLSLEFLQMLDEENLMQRVMEVGTFFRKKLRRLQRDVPGAIQEVRGMGLMVAAELNFSGKNVVAKMLERGFLMNCTHDTVLRFLPPYIIKKAEITALVTALGEVLAEEPKQMQQQDN
ncbi:MAG: acetylornithine/succinylornithine family transaminase [Acidobacteriota bacterium]|nr:acetylornithine/succinylornithine family transaminase [Acidobacteriota bacterium]